VSERRVVITGLGPITPIGVGGGALWASLLERRSGIRPIQFFDPSRFDSRIGGEIDGIKLGDCVPKTYRKAGKIMARDIVLAVAGAHEAVTDAGLVTKCLVDRGEAEAVTVDSTRLGANIGAGLICADLSELAEALSTAAVDDDFRIVKWGAEGMSNLTPLWLLKFLPNMLACHVTIVHDCQGPSNTVTCGEASSHLAIGEACRTIQRGVADVCICGGAESKGNPMALLRQSLGKRLSTRNDQPATACRPFGADRDGTVTSEGAGILILEELEHARKRSARIYAEIAGFGAANDAYAPTQPSPPHPEGRGIALAAKKALNDAGMVADQIDLVSAGASGLVDRDAAEAKAIGTILGPRVSDTPVLAVRGAMGNNGAGSGAIDVTAALLAMHHNTLPGTVGGQAPDAAFGLKINTGDPVDAKIDIALCNGYALAGGQCASLVLRKYRD
jgi:3-oxoacyl-[acyl-carrier-protein] synthase II